MHNIIISDVLDSHLEAIEAPGCTHTHNYDGTSGGTIRCSINEDLDQENNSGSVYIVARLRGVDENTVIPNTPWASTVETGWQEGSPLTIGGEPPSNLVIQIFSPDTSPPYEAPQVVKLFGEVGAGTEPVTLDWDFGNGQTVLGTEPGFKNAVTTTYNLSGTYTVVMTATNVAGEAVATTVITVTGEPDVDVTPATIDETRLEGYTAFTKTLTISNTAAATDLLTWEVAEPAAAWLSVQSPITSGTLLPGEGVQVTMHITGGLTLAEYTSAVMIMSNDVDVTVPVTFTVESEAEPQISVTPTSLAHSANEGDTTTLTRTLTIANDGNATLTWNVTITPTAEWLSVDAASGSTEAGMQSSLTVSFDPTDLVSDTYTSNLSITSNDADVLVPVTFEITKVEEDFEIFLPLVLKLQP